MDEIETLKDVEKLDEVFSNTCTKLLDKNIRIYSCNKKDNFLSVSIYKNSLCKENIDSLKEFFEYGLVKERRIDNNNLYTIVVPYYKDETKETVDNKFGVIVDRLQDQDILYGSVPVDEFYDYCYVELLLNKKKREFILKNMFLSNYVSYMYDNYKKKGLIYEDRIYLKKLYLDKHKKYLSRKTLNK